MFRGVLDVLALWRASRGADVVLLSEFRISHAAVAWAVARLRRSTFVVDHFVGLHETVVEDHGAVRPGGLRARRLAFLDGLSLRLADLCVTDTAVRAARLSTRARREVFPLPVGAPEWIAPSTTPSDGGAQRLQFLYAGNYLPLHGVDRIADLFSGIAARCPARMTFIGAGPARPAVEDRMREAGLSDRCAFVDPVPPDVLAREIACADVVFGVFGDSAKARSVVPNKVWQGLAAGKVVVTQDTEAVRELQPVVGRALVLVDRAAPRAGDVLADVRAALGRTPVGDARAALEAFVATSFERFGDALVGTRR